MLRGMTGSQLAEWMAYDRIETPDDPFWRTARLAFTIARTAGVSGAKFEDYLPPARRQKQPRQAQSPAEMKAAMDALAAMQNGRAK